MSNDPVGRRPRSADLHSTLRVAALATVAVGVVLLAAAAFALSYQGIHQIARQAGVSPGLAKLYPLIFDAMLVIAGAAALALRGASWWARCYAWASLLILLAALAIGNALHATGTTLPAQPTKAAVAVIPWVLLLMAFGLLLEMLRHFRTTRSAAAKAAAAGAASASSGVGVNGERAAATQAASSAGKLRELPRVDLDTLLGPRGGQPPPIEITHDTGAGENAGHQADPVSYGEETGYVHPDSYLAEGEYSPHGDTGGPGSHAGQAGNQDGQAGDHAGQAGNQDAQAGDHAGQAGNQDAQAGDHAGLTAGQDGQAGSQDRQAGDHAGLTAGQDGQAGSQDGQAGDHDGTAPARPGTTAAETPAAAPEAPDTSAEAPATSAEAPAGEAAPGTENGPAAGGDRAAVETPAGPAEAGPAGDGVTQEAAGTEGPALERIRSTPTRPED